MEAMEAKVIGMGFYWYGYSNDIIKLIDKCGVCHSERYGQKVLQNPKIIRKSPVKTVSVSFNFFNHKIL